MPLVFSESIHQVTLPEMPMDLDFSNDGSLLAVAIVDLGPPMEGMEYGEKCSTCGSPKIVSNRAFLKGFHRDQWQGADFCTSTFFGNDFLYISQRVFRFLDRLPDEEKEDLVFRPLNLIETPSGM